MESPSHDSNSPSKAISQNPDQSEVFPSQFKHFDHILFPLFLYNNLKLTYILNNLYGFNYKQFPSSLNHKSKYIYIYIYI